MRGIQIITVLLAICGPMSRSAAFAGENYAFLVAVADYDEKELRPLKYTRPDILEFHDTLLKSGYKPANVVVMHDDFEKLVEHYKQRGMAGKVADYLPEGRKIRTEFKLLLGLLRPDDSVIVAFAGHGVQFSGQKKSYFCPKDARLDDVESLISFEELYQALSISRAGRRMLLVDACQNDPQSEISRSRATVELDSVTRPQTEAVPQGVIALFSCKEGEKSFEHAPLGHGIFFYHILEGWNGKADANGDGRLTYLELADYAETKTRRYAYEKLKVNQTPTLESKFSGDWFLRTLFPTKPGKPVNNSIGMKLVLLPPGEFKMGDPNAGADADNPAHLVRITKPFYIGLHEVTLRSYRMFVEAERYQTSSGAGYDTVKKQFAVNAKFDWKTAGWTQTDSHPVVNVSWNDADAFCKWLSKKEGKTYRLPTEAEWEYACRGGTKMAYSTGDSPDTLVSYANVADAALKGRIPGIFSQKGTTDWTKPWDDGFAFTAPVGSFRANPFGLFDMHGNVQEWCGDWYGKDYYRFSPTDNPTGPPGGAARVKRGGDYLGAPTNAASHYRYSDVAPGNRGHFIGFRVVREAE